MPSKVVARFEDRLPAELVEDIRWVQKLIADKPEQLDMDRWIDPESTPCNTVACIAGHMAVRRMPEAKVLEAFAKQQISNGLCDLSQVRELSAAEDRLLSKTTYALSDLADVWMKKAIPQEFEYRFERLFYTDYWPSKFITKAGNVTAKLTVKRIDYFLEHGE